jgi:hypothetical protein
MPGSEGAGRLRAKKAITKGGAAPICRAGQLQYEGEKEGEVL